MLRITIIVLLVLLDFGAAAAQSRRAPNYSDSAAEENECKARKSDATAIEKPAAAKTHDADDDAIRVSTDLIVINAKISERGGKFVPKIGASEFRVFENGVEQQIAYFSDEEKPFTVALVLDMSYSSVVKLKDIQAAALEFIAQLRADDRVLVVSFDEKTRVLCEATGNRKVLRYAVEAAEIASGTSLYDSLETVLRDKLKNIRGRKAVVVLSDGVDTTSRKASAADVLRQAATGDAIVYPIQYNTYDDVQKNHKESADVYYDDFDRRIIVAAPEVAGERKEDYKQADDFFKTIAESTNGKVYRVASSENLTQAFKNIADELRKIYSLGYYSSDEKQAGAKYSVRVRVYRPNLIVRARDGFIWQP